VAAYGGGGNESLKAISNESLYLMAYCGGYQLKIWPSGRWRRSGNAAGAMAEIPAMKAKSSIF